MTQLCLCGCGRTVNEGRSYIHGHNGRGIPRSESTKQKISIGNKGKKASKETISKLQISHTGKVRSLESRLKQAESIRGPKNHFFGKHHTKESNEKNRLSHIGIQDGVDNPFYGKHHTMESKRNNAEKHTGEKSYGWRGGISFKPYCHKFNKRLKEAVRDRDNRTCQLCGTKENGRGLDVHHIHYDKENCQPDLIALCNKCHMKINGNRDYYENIFMNNLNDRKLLLWSKEGT